MFKKVLFSLTFVPRSHPSRTTSFSGGADYKPRVPWSRHRGRPWHQVSCIVLSTIKTFCPPSLLCDNYDVCLLQVLWTVPPPRLRGEPASQLHRPLLKPMALPPTRPIAHLNASLLISNTNIISSPPVHPIPPLLPTGPARSLPLRLLVGQTNILPL